MTIAAEELSSADVRKIEALGRAFEEVRAEIGLRIIGQNEVVEDLLIALLAEGHCLIVGVNCGRASGTCFCVSMNAGPELKIA